MVLYFRDLDKFVDASGHARRGTEEELSSAVEEPPTVMAFDWPLLDGRGRPRSSFGLSQGQPLRVLELKGPSLNNEGAKDVKRGMGRESKQLHEIELIEQTRALQNIAKKFIQEEKYSQKHCTAYFSAPSMFISTELKKANIERPLLYQQITTFIVKGRGSPAMLT